MNSLKIEMGISYENKRHLVKDMLTNDNLQFKKCRIDNKIGKVIATANEIRTENVY